MGCGTTLVKYLLFLFNFVFVVGGITLVALGALTYTKFEHYDDLMEQIGVAGFRGPPIAMMIGGGIVFFIAFLGCCGAIRESPFMMSAYGTILTILLIVQIGAVIAAALYKDDAEKALKNGFVDSMAKYGGSSEKDKEITTTWDNMQERIQCCGTDSYNDWNNVSKPVPPTCCKAGKESCPGGLPFPNIDTEKIYTQGCF